MTLTVRIVIGMIAGLTFGAVLLTARFLRVSAHAIRVRTDAGEVSA